ncbi:hypothetical protein MMC25_001522 [Agyrium rufum]|nr:hypothetical protein [Agyrium rufum]
MSHADDVYRIFDVFSTSYPASLPPESWYIALASTLVACSDPNNLAKLYTFMTRDSDNLESTTRHHLNRRFREFLLRQWITTGVAKCAIALGGLIQVEQPGDADLSFTRSIAGLDAANRDRGDKLLRRLYGDAKVDTMYAPMGADMEWFSKEVCYGLFWSANTILSALETELVNYIGITCQGLSKPHSGRLEAAFLRRPLTNHLSALRSLGVTYEQAEAVTTSVKQIAVWAGNDTSSWAQLGGVECHGEYRSACSNGHRLQKSTNVNADGFAMKNIDSMDVSSSSIMICGLALRLPGGISNAESFWELLHNGKDARSLIPSDRYNVNGFNASLGGKGAIETQHGYFLTENLACLDTSFFTLTKNELEKTDPQQRQLLEVVRECLENSGEVDYRGKLIGCYVGTFGEDWLYMAGKESQHTGGYVMTGHGDLMLANRVSYEYDFLGPSMVIKTGCSASLVALHEACRALQNGDCDAAIVAGTNLILGPTTTSSMTQEGIISPEGSCKTFDMAADGFARGEAINAVYIKRSDLALRDNNPLRAVIRSTVTNSDGKGQGLMKPNGRSQELLMKKAYSDANLNPMDTGYVECHGTGTPTGDPIECSAVGNIFGDNGVFIGSVKPNVGHSEGASGLTSLIKVVLALENSVIPPNIKFVHPNPKIPFLEKRLQVPVSAIPWPRDRAQRASINSFGIGGTNVHVIVESAIGYHMKPTNAFSKATLDVPKLLLFSANAQESLNRHIARYEEYIQLHPDRISDLAYTLSHHREYLPYRAYSVVTEKCLILTSPTLKISTSAIHSVLVFSGQGAQWPGMGSELIKQDPHFKSDIVSMDEILQSLRYAPDWSIEAELLKPAGTSRIHKAELAQPLCTAIQIGLFNLLRRAGFQAAAVIGHSSGEIAAAYACGSLSLIEAMVVAYYRGYINKEQSIKPGGMAAVGLPSNITSEYLRDGVIIACENSPNSTTISGDLEQLRSVLDQIRKDQPQIFTRLLKVDRAYHSHHMKPLGPEYQRLIECELQDKGIIRHDPQTLFISTVTGEALSYSAAFSPVYWQSNLLMPVRFSSAIDKLLSSKSGHLFVEIGPHSTLAGPLRQICEKAGVSCSYIPTMIRDQDCTQSLLSSFGQFYQRGVAFDMRRLNSDGKVLVDLPTYSWEHNTTYWHENRVSKDWRFRTFGHHALLGQKIPESTDLEPLWRNMLNLDDEPWLLGHQILKDVVFPLAGYVSMAGEAIRQITGTAAFSLRRVVARAALVLYRSKSTELVTSIRPRRLTDSTDSEWYNFTISSYTGSVWIMNCEGQVKPLIEPTTATSSKTDQKFPRNLQPARWYKAMADVGIVYGPSFQCLSAISSATTENVASGEIESHETHHQTHFTIHPALIDACLQLTLVALVQGKSCDLNQLAVPTVIEELDVYQKASHMHATAQISVDKKAMTVECITDGKPVLRLNGIQLTPLDADIMINLPDAHAAAQLEWYCDIDFVNIGSLLRPPTSESEDTKLREKLCLLCMIDTEERLQGLVTREPHFEKYRGWLRREVLQAKVGDHPLIDNTSDLVALSQPSRFTAIKELESRLSTRSKPEVTRGMLEIWENVEGLFTGKLIALEVLMRDNLLTRIYDSVSFGHGDLVRLLSNNKPDLRILEVGAGTGGTTQLIVEGLMEAGGFSTYCFSDVSAGFFPQAKERFRGIRNMDFRVFDISRDPLEQGFAKAYFDLILAPNVIHATPCLLQSLQNLRILLKPDGYLVLTELCTISRTPNYMFGNFSGWWLGEGDNRPTEPYVSIDRWDFELREAGFNGVETAVRDADEPFQMVVAIVSRPLKNSAVSSTPRSSMTVLCENPEKVPSVRIIDHLRRIGYSVSVSSLDGYRGSCQNNVISILDLETPFFENISAQNLIAFQRLLFEYGPERPLLWLTIPSQIRCKDPRAAQSIGIARTVRSELGLPFCTLEIDSTEVDFVKIIEQVFVKVCSIGREMGSLDPDQEFAVSNGDVHISRYRPLQLSHGLLEDEKPSSCRAIKLDIARSGQLESLRWIKDVSHSEFSVDDVEVEANAIGLNFRDVVAAMGLIFSGSNSAPFGLEVAGTVRRVGSNVHDLVVGDRVYALSPHGCFSNTSILSASLCVRLPNDLNFEEAATMPLCFATALHALFKVGQLRRADTILIHSACGGVGIAAIQVCKMVGAEIFATVSTEEKVCYLTETFGIRRDHIFTSRDQSFLAGIMRQTNGLGVDIVLNSLSGELLHASWKCVAEFGKLIEIGKRDHVEHGSLDMQPFLANRSYCCVDIAGFLQRRPQEMKEILESCLDLYRDGHIQPIRPISIFDACNVEDAFRHLQRGNHIGKVVIRAPTDTASTISPQRERPIQFDAEATYLLVGGFGGLGKAVAVWMVQHGAQHLTFLSRRVRLTDADKATLNELHSLGCMTHVATGDVSDLDDVKKITLSSERHIKGIIHLAMVLRDGSITEMTHEDWLAVNAPKVDGAWNLHNAFADQAKLDFFLLASSVTTVINQPGQGNYMAANTFLEAFCQYRHSLGLPASVLNISALHDIGFVAENPVAKKKLELQGFCFLGEREFLDCVKLSILGPSPRMTADNPANCGWKNVNQLVMGLRSEIPLDHPNNRTKWRHDPRMRVYHTVETAEPNLIEDDTLVSFLSQNHSSQLLDSKANAEFVACEIGKKVFDLMLKPDAEVDISQSLTQMGLDSLMAVEMRLWWLQVFGFQISILEMLASGTLESLGRLAIEGVKKRLAMGTDESSQQL